MTNLEFTQLFPFALDEFQQHAIAALNANKSVVVCAPTGSGKTLIGEYAIYRALSQGRRVFYTTPLKALSNQKLRDFRQQFGYESVGLVTGDLSVNRDAPVLVMTTEIFRNMLYGTPIGQVGTSLTGVETVVLDECHYMNDRQRGTVWEESIIYCPPDIQLVALSATIANSEQLTAWIGRVHGPTELIYSDFRPVPLKYHFYNQKGMFPLLAESCKKINPLLLNPKGKRNKNSDPRRKRDALPQLTDILATLQEQDMLPAIYFIFSRRGCDRAVDAVSNFSLLKPGEAEQLREHIREFLKRYPEASRHPQLGALYCGIAAHHSGLLPAWKGIVEELFQLGLIKVVFATETLAAGINMPARTTVISSLSKRTDDGHRLLKPSEFLQISGRAGRRGMDAIGHVVTLETAFEGAREAAYLAISEAEPLVSQFTPSYGMVLNLLQTHSLEQVKGLIERSFGQFISGLGLQPQQQAIADLKAFATRIEAQLRPLGTPDELEQKIASYEKIQQRLKEEKRLLKILQQQSYEMQAKDLVKALEFASLGTFLSLKGKYIPVQVPLFAVLVEKVTGGGQIPYLICLATDNRWYVASSKDIIALYADIPCWHAAKNLTPPLDLIPKPGQSRKGNEETANLLQKFPRPPVLETPPEVIEQLERIAQVQAQLETHPLYEMRDRGTLFKRMQALKNALEELQERETILHKLQSRHWEEFLDLISILQHFNCLESDLVPTELGQAAATIRGDNELWLGLVLMSRELDDLEPHHLAAACAAIVTETARPDSWTRYITSPEIEEALGKLRSLRQRLFQQQRRRQVALPVWLEYDLIAIVEQWAAGVDWLELCDNTSLDEGDIVRMLRRTLDFLSQIPHVPHLSASLRQNASDAIRLMDRFPVKEAID